MKIIKKIVSLIALISLISTSLLIFSSCASPYTEEEAREILAEVLAKDVELNQIIWGEGLSPENDPEEHINDSTFYYMEVSMLSKYTSLDELKEAVKETYAEELLDIVWQYAFGYDGIQTDHIPRYAQNKNGYLQVNVAKSTLKKFDLTSVAYIGESKIVRAKKDMIKIDILVSSDGENFRERTLELYLIDGIWKLDTQTWCIDFQY